MAYIGNTDQDRREMLQTLGLQSTADLFSEIPRNVRFPQLDLPAARTEMEVLNELAVLASRNVTGRGMSFSGAGAYHHFIPSVVPYLAGRGEFATAYTPYQAEASQGTLQSIFEYQSMICNLLDMEVANASHYDGATAVAEAAIMAVRASRGRGRIIASGSLHPEYLDVSASYLEPQGIAFDVISRPENPGDAGPVPADLVDAIDDETAAVVIASPDFFGTMHDLSGIAEQVHERGALLIVHTDPIACALFRSPGSFGADIVTGEGQPLGIPVSFGGPYLGLFAARLKLVRKMPGRLVGQTTDSGGERGFVLTLNTREQHIRREKATSNICTNQGLMALRAAIYLSTMGPSGLREVAERCYQNAHYAASLLDRLPGCSVNGTGTTGLAGGGPGESAGTEAGGPSGAGMRPFFKEFILSVPVKAAQLVEEAAVRGVVPGVSLSPYFPNRANELLVAVTEIVGRAEIETLRDVIAAVTEGRADG